jgi:outer membrane protein assembly factor BamB
MNPTTTARALLLTAALAPALSAQDWTDEQLVAACQGFQTESLPTRLQQVGVLLGERQHAFTALVARIHGDHREYRLKVDQLLDELGDPRWQVREKAERTLIEIGSRGVVLIQQRKDNFTVLEQQIRCGRILDALVAKGDAQEKLEKNLLRGLVSTALYLDAEPRLVRALRSALGHTEATIGDAAIRALGKHGGDDEADSVGQMVGFKNGIHRLVSVSALGRMRSPKALAMCRQLLGTSPIADGPFAGITLNPTERMAIVRALHSRDDDDARAMLTELEQHPDTALAAAARTKVPAGGTGVVAKFTVMPDRSQVDGQLGGFFGESMLVTGAFPGLASAELSFSDCDTMDFPDHVVKPITEARVFLNQGSLVAGAVLSIDPESVKIESARFGKMTLSRKDIQGIAFKPSLDRLVGGSTEFDRVRLPDATFVEGKVVRADASTLVVATAAGERSLAIGDVDGLLFTRPRQTEPDTTTYARFETVTGERILGFIGDNSAENVVVVVPQIGATVLPLRDVRRIELGVGGGAMWGFTLIADYSDNRIVEVDEQGRELFKLEEVFGAWDAECLDNGNLLITEFSVSRVQEVDRTGKQVWFFDALKNPYDADRLQNGNTLIADTFASRVIEVDQAGKIVWSYDKDIRPFDVDRLQNGNTLIADVMKDRIIEVDPAGEIVWEVKGMPNAHDADRLPGGNTLVTLRNKGAVLEIDRDGKVVWELQGLSSPSDADRLPNGNTIVAENTRVREFDRRGNEIWKKEMTWAVEVNRY